MFIRLMQATAITLALYGLLSLSDWQTITSQAEQSESEHKEITIETPEVIVAIKQALTRR